MPRTADPYAYRPEGSAVDYNWTGIYFGGHVGGALGEANWTFTNPTEGTKHQDASIAGGAQVGLQKQWDWIVLGAEVSYTWADLGRTKASTVAPGTSLTSETNDLLVVAGRLGFTRQNLLAYAKLGYATADVAFRSSVTATGVVTTASSERVGGTVAGFGIEYGLTPHISIGAEYDWVQLQVGDRTQIPTPAGVAGSGVIDASVNIQSLVARLNFKFGPGHEPVPYK